MKIVNITPTVATSYGFDAEKAVMFICSDDRMKPRVPADAKLIGASIIRDQLEKGQAIGLYTTSGLALIGRLGSTAADEQMKVIFDNPQYDAVHFNWCDVAALYGNLFMVGGSIE